MGKFVALAVAAAFAVAAVAQDMPKPPAGREGKAAAIANSILMPHPVKMTETPPGEIPVSKLRVPAGFKVEIWASGIPGARAMARTDDGKKLYVGTRVIGRVYEVTDLGDKRTARTVVDKLAMPSGVAFKDGALWVFALDKVLRFDGIEQNPKPQPQDLTAKFDLASAQHHQWKYVAFGPDG